MSNKVFFLTLILINFLSGGSIVAENKNLSTVCSSQEILEYANKNFQSGKTFNPSEIKKLFPTPFSYIIHQGLNNDEVISSYRISIDSDGLCNNKLRAYGFLSVNIDENKKFINFSKALITWQEDGYKNTHECFSIDGSRDCYEAPKYNRSYNTKNPKINFLKFKQDKSLNHELKNNFKNGTDFSNVKYDLIHSGAVYTQIFSFYKSNKIEIFHRFDFSHPSLFPLFFTNTIVIVDVNESNKVTNINGRVVSTGL